MCTTIFFKNEPWAYKLGERRLDFIFSGKPIKFPGEGVLRKEANLKKFTYYLKKWMNINETIGYCIGICF